MRYYGKWAGKPKGTPEDKTRCITEVAEGGRSLLLRQCYRKRGHGENGLFCKQHAKICDLGYDTGPIDFSGYYAPKDKPEEE